jgi:ABC-type branched-subunit amino acid transport system ATPase component
MLADRLGQRADSQSDGERQVLAIARALMRRPTRLLLDEPSAGLSPLMVERVFEMLTELRRRDGVAILRTPCSRWRSPTAAWCWWQANSHWRRRPATC